MELVAAYVGGAQDELRLNRAEVAVRLKERMGKNIDPSTIWRIRKGDQVPGGDMLLALIDVLGLNPSDVLYLFRAVGVSEQDAEQMGRRAARGEVNEEVIRDAWRRVPSSERDAARARIIAELESN